MNILEIELVCYFAGVVTGVSLTIVLWLYYLTRGKK